MCYELLYDYQSRMNNDSSGDSQMVDSNVGTVGSDGMKRFDLFVIKKKELELHMLEQSWMFI